MMKTACQLLALGIAAAQANELFLKDEAPATPYKREGVETETEKATIDIDNDEFFSLNIGDYLSWFNITNFSCSNPIGFTDFKAADLEGSWFQAYASRSTNVYGCLSYNIVADTDSSSGDLPAINVNAGWTAFNTYWNPLQKGEYTA